MLSSFRDALLMLSKTTSPQKLFLSDCITLYRNFVKQEPTSIREKIFFSGWSSFTVSCWITTTVSVVKIIILGMLKIVKKYRLFFFLKFEFPLVKMQSGSDQVMYLGVRAVYPAGGDLLGLLLAQQGGHLRQDLSRYKYPSWSETKKTWFLTMQGKRKKKSKLITKLSGWSEIKKSNRRISFFLYGEWFS